MSIGSSTCTANKSSSISLRDRSDNGLFGIGIAAILNDNLCAWAVEADDSGVDDPPVPK